MINRNVTKQHLNHPHGTPDAPDAQNRLRAISTAVGIYVAIVTATIAALGILSRDGAASGHAGRVGPCCDRGRVRGGLPALAEGSPGRPSRRASRGRDHLGGPVPGKRDRSDDPGLFPLWMRAEMIGIALVMAVVIVLVARERSGAREDRRAT